MYPESVGLVIKIKVLGCLDAEILTNIYFFNGGHLKNSICAIFANGNIGFYI